MRNRNWNKAAIGLALCSLAAPVLAQTPAAVATEPSAPSSASATESMDLLVDALTCRVPYERYPSLMQQLRRERPDDFIQTYRQYSDPVMDLYRLDVPVQAWGSTSDALVIASNRVMIAVEGSLEEITSSLESALEQSSQSPLSGALDDQHALVIFEAKQPGLEGMVLLGCEYRIPDISLLDDPADAWRKKTFDTPSSTQQP